ncbi:glycosyltransferase family 2 protein [Aquabacter spiritensis]|uniref:Glycosyl transferase family 2 n=1 Tax=Aquabacter spiritensis TaxID=933073 RepID=A0A4R3LVG3_9HYPH|nr:glycosyltransferase family 2 protein [Aquabacter spiritensis]TCT02427.1 glycosyl transferase family 2 [Aquabacter spiritensis]
MRLASLTMARDEADIIEAFVRHNLTFLDRMYVIDDGSSDATPRILALLQAEGLPVELVADGQHASFSQGQRTTRLMRHAMRQEAWDFILPIDADEFIDAPDRARLEAELAALPAPHIGAFSLTNYVPDLAAPPADPLACTRVLDLDRIGNKVIIPGAIAGHSEALVSDGNHEVSHWHVEMPKRLLASVDLAHFPIRSTAQLTAKCLISYMRWRARPDYQTNASAHLIEGARALIDEPGLALQDPERLLHAYLPYAAGALRTQPFVNRRGVVRHGDLAATFPYRRILDSVDTLIETARAQAREVETLRYDMARATAPFHVALAREIRKYRRSIMRRILRQRVG